jgi:hypothetical protein
MRSLKAGIAYFGLVFGAGFLLGSIRVPFLVPRLGMRVAELIEMPIMLMVVLWSARIVVRRFAVPPSIAMRLSTGLIALGLLIAAEIALVVVLQRQSLSQYIASRDPVSGSVYLAMLGLYAGMPLILARTQWARLPSSQDET